MNENRPIDIDHYRKEIDIDPILPTGRMNKRLRKDKRIVEKAISKGIIYEEGQSQVLIDILDSASILIIYQRFPSLFVTSDSDKPNVKMPPSSFSEIAKASLSISTVRRRYRKAIDTINDYLTEHKSADAKRYKAPIRKKPVRVRNVVDFKPRN